MIQIYDTDVIFQKNWYALKNVNLKIEKGEFVFVTGPSGCGKTTLLRLMYMDLFPSKGEVIVAGFRSSSINKKEIPLLRRKIGVIFQDFKLLQDRDVFDNVSFALQVTGTRKKLIKEKVLKTLADVHLSHKRDSFPYQLSGGEQQRVAIARALVREPFILLADEPTGNIDPQSTKEILELLKNINASGTAVVMATHELDIVKKSPYRKIALKMGEIIEDTNENLKEEIFLEEL
ncbi:MAG: cell division ATP-binding protein FtsE [Candidatus Cloacimonas sp. 4484_209]|nr:MAG: cell division ATP-binding protein FtsE [Candidatus Cloacimonas sp. 4484_209]